MGGLIKAFLIVGGAAGIGLIITSLFGGGFDIKGLLDKFKKKKDEIEKIEDKQKDVVKKVIESKRISEEKKKEIKKIREKANKEIVDTLEKEDLASLVLEEEGLWDE